MVVPVAGRPVLSIGNFDLAPMHYVVGEFFLSGSADDFRRREFRRLFSAPLGRYIPRMAGDCMAGNM